MSVRLRITYTAAICAVMSSTAMVLGAGIAAACEGTGGGGGGCTAPTVSTGSATAITSESATLNGTVNPQGCETDYYFEYGTGGSYPNSVGGWAGNGTFPQSVQTYSSLGLQPSTKYNFRLSAINSEGMETTGSVNYFTTAPACTKPTVTTEAASFVGSDKAFLNGKVNPNGCEASYTFEYGLAGSGTYTKLTGTVGALGPFSVSKEASGLQANKLYTFGLSATNTKGTTDGSFLYFTTKPKYVALGDSYSSGYGSGSYYDSYCKKSVYGYPELLHNAHPDWGFINATCEGAYASYLINVEANSLSEDVTWVTYTIGGNDAEFENVLRKCAGPEVECWPALDKAQNIIVNQLPGILDGVNKKIKEKAPNAKVIVLNYPRLFNGKDCTTLYSVNEQSQLNTTADMMKNVIYSATVRAGANFVFRDVIPGFIGHAVCDGGSGSSTEWIKGPTGFWPGESFHPKILGQADGYYPVVHGVTG
jgi:lysophospholipase L1-like esterase